MIEFLFGPEWLMMSIAPLVAAAGITALASGANAISQGSMNRKSRRFQEKMFDKTNKYNSPVEQMKRLRAAGLNPNLVYGGSSGGTAGTASQPAKPDFQPLDFSGIGDAGVQYFQNRAIESQIAVNAERAENIRQDTVNKGIKAVEQAINAAKGNINLNQMKELYGTTIKTAEERLRNLSVNTDYTRGRDRREEQVINETEEKLRQDIKNAKLQGRILSEEGIMKRIDRIMYQEYRIRPQDPAYMRIMTEIIQGLGFGFGNFWDNFKEKTSKPGYNILKD